MDNSHLMLRKTTDILQRWLMHQWVNLRSAYSSTNARTSSLAHTSCHCSLRWRQSQPANIFENGKLICYLATPKTKTVNF